MLWSDLHQLDVTELAQVRPPDSAGRLCRRGGSGPGSTVVAQDGPARLLPGADAQRLERERSALAALHHLWSARANRVGAQPCAWGWGW